MRLGRRTAEFHGRRRPGRGNAGGQGGSGGSGGGDTTTSDTVDTHTSQQVFESGTRLRARLHDGGNGAVQFLGWQDSQIGEACYFREIEPGKMRCLPGDSSQAAIWYLDAACSQPVGVRMCGSSAKYATVTSGPMSCQPGAAPVDVYQLDAPLPAGPTFSLSGGACSPNGPIAQGAELHKVSKISLDTFTAGTVSQEPRGDRLSLRVIVGADGSRETRSIRDVTGGFDCASQAVAKDDLRCAPPLTTLMSGAYFTDAACKNSLLVQMSPGGACGSGAFAHTATVDTCDMSWSGVPVGNKVTPQNLYQGGPGICVPAAAVPQGWSFYEQGTPVDTKTLAKILRHTEGSGRLQMPLDMTEEQLDLMPAGAFFDAERNQPCHARSFADGKLRCVPEDVQQINWYSDTACTVPLVTVASDPACPAALPTEAILEAAQIDPLCSLPRTVQHVYALGAKWNGAKIYGLSGAGKCTGIDTSLLGADVYDIGKELDPSAFAELTAKTE